jgi:hypothetical protein
VTEDPLVESAYAAMGEYRTLAPRRRRARTVFIWLSVLLVLGGGGAFVAGMDLDVTAVAATGLGFVAGACMSIGVASELAPKPSNMAPSDSNGARRAKPGGSPGTLGVTTTKVAKSHRARFTLPSQGRHMA